MVSLPTDVLVSPSILGRGSVCAFMVCLCACVCVCLCVGRGVGRTGAGSTASPIEIFEGSTLEAAIEVKFQKIRNRFF